MRGGGCEVNGAIISRHRATKLYVAKAQPPGCVDPVRSLQLGCRAHGNHHRTYHSFSSDRRFQR